MHQLTLEEKCYLAGFVDGEGCLCVYRRWHTNNLNGRVNKWTGFTISLCLTSTNPSILPFLKGIIGYGSISEKNKKGNRKQAWEYRICGLQAQKIVEQIFPFLHIKRDIAECFLRFPLAGRGSLHHCEELKEEIYLQAKDLNFRGINKRAETIIRTSERMMG